ncbi:MAG: hypothetical protein AUI83_00100 [Armatimonadetes bacterium 13_1_40CM_3_65_7]|nr:MAG: hypothetical protein AUI83_00100 [Armatimonadetes bacterium 13_1_40CM_3_65_7]
MKSIRSLALIALAVLAVGLIATPQTEAQIIPAIWFIGLNPTLPPADLPDFRLALAYAIDREAVTRAAAANTKSGTPMPAGNIQHPNLPGYNPAVRGHSYDPAKAKALYIQSGWTSPINILTGSSTGSWVIAVDDAVTGSIRSSLGAKVSLARVANFATLVSATKSGKVPIWMYGWGSDPQDFGYPSFALGLAEGHFMSDPDIRALVEKGAAQAVEQMLLDRALLIPIIFYPYNPPR